MSLSIKKKTLRKVVSSITAITTIVWLSGIYMFGVLPVASSSEIVDGDIIRSDATNPDGTPALSSLDVYIVKIVGTKKFKRLILNPEVFNSYEHLDWGNVKVVSESVMNEYTTSSLVRVDKALDPSEKVYALAPDGDVGSKSWINLTEEQFVTEAGSDPDSIYTINLTDAGNYTSVDDITTVSQLTEFYASGTLPGTSTTGGLTVSLAADTPAAATLIAGSAYNDFTKVNLTAGSEGSATITGITVTRTGYSNDNDVAGLLVKDSSGNRHGNVVTLSENKATINFESDPIVVAAGATDYITIQVNLDRANATSGTIGMSIAEASDISTTSSVSGSFPISGNLMGMTASTGILGELSVDESIISTSVRTVDLGVTDQQIGKFKFTSENSNEDVYLRSVTVYNNGTSADGDVANIDFVAPDGTVLATVAETSDKYATFDFSATPYKISKGTNKIFTVRADVVSGSNRTTQFVIQNDYDVDAYGGSTGVGILATATGTVDTAGFPIGDNGANDNTIQASSGTLTVSKDSSSPSGEVSVGATEVVIGVWKLQASGEDMQLMKVDVDLGEGSGTATSADVAGTLRVKIDDSTVWSASATTASLWDGNSDQVTLSSYATIPANSSKLLSIVTDINSSATSGNTIMGSLANLYYKKMSTNSYATAQPSTTSWSRANLLTISSSSLTVTKNSAVPSETKIKGASELLVGSFSLQAGAAEDVNVNTINVDLNAVTGLTNLLIKDETGTQLGSTIASPSATSGANSFSVSGQLNVPASSTKIVNVYVDTSTNVGSTITTTIPASGISATGANSSNTITAPTADVAGQTMTMASSGTLTVSLNATTTPSAAVLHAGETNVDLDDIKFTASTAEDITLNKIEIAIFNGEANYSNVSLWDGSTQVGSTTNLVNGVATFTGLSKTISRDSSVTLRVKADTNISGAIKSQLKTKVAVRYVEATGEDSGTILKPGVSSIDGASTSGVSDSYELGQVVVFAEGTTNNETALAITTTAGTGTTAGFDFSTTADRTDNTITATTDSLVAFPYISTELATGATGVKYSYAVGDVVLFRDNSTSGTYVGHIAATTPTVTYYDDAGNAAVAAAALEANDRIAKLYSGGTMETLTAASVTNTYTAGQAVYYYDANAASNFAVVSTGGTGSNPRFALASKGQGIATPASGDVVITIPYISTESPASATATTNSYTVGDVVLYYDASASHTYLAIVTATPTATTPTFTADGDNVSIATGSYATGDYIVKLYSAGAVSKRMTIHDGEPVITSESSISGSPNTNQKIAEFSVLAQGREINITSVDLKASGSNRPWQYVTSYTLKNGTTTLSAADTLAADTQTAGTANVLTGTGLALCSAASNVAGTMRAAAAGDLTEMYQKLKKGDTVVIFKDTTNYITATVTGIDQGATTGLTGGVNCQTANASDVHITVTGSTTTGTAPNGTDVTKIYSNGVHFDSNATTALSSQTISKDSTLVLTVYANTSNVKSGLTSGTATFGVILDGIASQDPSSTESYGLTWGYTPAGGSAVTGLQISDSYPQYGPTFNFN